MNFSARVYEVTLTLLWIRFKVQRRCPSQHTQTQSYFKGQKSRRRGKWLLIFSFFFFTEPTQSLCPSFVKGPTITPFACLLTIFSDRDRPSVAGGLGVRVVEALCRLHLPGPDSSMSKDKVRIVSRLSPDGCCLRGDHTEESGRWGTHHRTSSTLKRQQSAYQIVLRFHLFSKDSKVPFIRAS